MNREEILARSQQENRGQDIASLEVSKQCILVGWLVAVVLLAVVSVVDAIVFDRMNNEIFFAVMAGCATIFLIKYWKLRRRHELVIGLVYTVAALLFLIAWILQLAK